MAAAQQSFSQLGDEELMSFIADGNKLAFNELAGRHIRTLYAVAYRMNFDRGTAEDILQESFLRIWQKAHMWNKDAGAKVSTWIYRITYNICIDFKRKNIPIAMEELPEQKSTEPLQDEIAMQNENSRIVESALKKLPDAQREAMILCHYQELSNAEAAEIMGKTVKAVESLLVRGKRALYEMLTDKKELLAGGNYGSK